MVGWGGGEAREYKFTKRGGGGGGGGGVWKVKGRKGSRGGVRLR